MMFLLEIKDVKVDTTLLNLILDGVGALVGIVGAAWAVWGLVQLGFQFFGERDGSGMKAALNHMMGGAIIAAAGTALVALL